MTIFTLYLNMVNRSITIKSRRSAVLKKLIFSALVWLFSFPMVIDTTVRAQELNARVEILSPQITHTNKRVLDVLERIISDYLNRRSWTGKQVQPSERIDCSVVITINSWDGSSEFSAQAQIMSMRPVYNTSYSSPVLNMVDRDFNFSYTEGQMMDYSDQQFMNNLTSLLAYYAYLIIGLDADTFSPNGGDQFYNSARSVVNNAQNTGYPGWRSMDGDANRYWLITNLQDRRYAPIRTFLYSFSRFGLDQLTDSREEARRNIIEAVNGLKDIDRFAPGAILDQIFFTAKSNELVGVLSNFPQQDRMQAYNLLISIDPSNSNKYEALRSR